MQPHTDFPAPDVEASRCQRCGCPLSAADGVCVQCDAELAAPPPAGPLAGKYNCPGCSLSFSKPVFTLEPVNAKWYVPQVQKLACPHCKTHLLDSRNPPLSTYQIFALLVLATCSPLLVPARHAQTVRIVLVFVLLAIYLWRRSWGVPVSRRYVRDET